LTHNPRRVRINAIVRNKTRTVVTRTLGDLSTGQRLWANCEHCGHSRKLDLDDLRTKYGTRMPLRRLDRMLRCRRCQQRVGKVMLTYTNSE
jgi:hypothetical protein